MQAHRFLALVAAVVCSTIAHAAPPLGSFEFVGGNTRISSGVWELATFVRRDAAFTAGAGESSFTSLPLSFPRRAASHPRNAKLELPLPIAVPDPGSYLPAQSANSVALSWPVWSTTAGAGNPRWSVEGLFPVSFTWPDQTKASKLLPAASKGVAATPKTSTQFSTVPESAPFLAVSLGILLAGVLRFRVLTV